MTELKQGFTPSHGQFLVYQAEDGAIKLDVRLENESVWLTQPILSIYEEEELPPEATHKNFLLVRTEGQRQVKRPVDFYNLNMII